MVDQSGSNDTGFRTRSMVKQVTPINRVARRIKTALSAARSIQCDAWRRASEITGQRSEVRGQRLTHYSWLRKELDFFIIPLSIRPISAHLLVNARCSSMEMYSQSLAKSSDESVSLFSPSESVSLLTKCASYRRLCPRFSQVEAN